MFGDLWLVQVYQFFYLKHTLGTQLMLLEAVQASGIIGVFLTSWVDLMLDIDICDSVGNLPANPFHRV